MPPAVFNGNDDEGFRPLPGILIFNQKHNPKHNNNSCYRFRPLPGILIFNLLAGVFVKQKAKSLGFPSPSGDFDF